MKWTTHIFVLVNGPFNFSAYFIASHYEMNYIILPFINRI